MSIAMINRVKVSGIKPTARLVAFLLADHYNDLTGLCFPSIPTLAAETGLSERSVIRALEELEHGNQIRINKSVGKSSKYILLFPATPDTLSPLTESHPCHSVTTTPDRESPHPCHAVTTPLTGCHPNHKEPEENHKLNRNEGGLGFYVEESQKPKRPKKTTPLTWNNQTGWVGLTPEIVVALNAINPGVDLEQEMAHANAWLIGQGKPHSPRAMSFLSNWLKKAKPAPEVVTIEFQRAETADMGWEDFMRLTWDGDQEELEDLIQNRKELNEEAKQS